ncbi:MAG: hypothetical protein HGB23_08490 [Chlorobiaceae bacterium]|nr:hypothetical protein [Chlorobiaceae bacterium]
MTTIDPLLNEDLHKWLAGSGSALALTYSFPWYGGASAYWASYYSSTAEHQATYHFGLNDTQVAATSSALQTWANVANLTFTQVSDTSSTVGDFRFAFSSDVTGWGWSYYPSSAPSASDVWINKDYNSNGSSWAVSSYNYYSLVHEIGHGLGLKHPGIYSSKDVYPILPAELDFRNYTVMSYNNWHQVWPGSTVVPETPMVYDIAAIQYLYGANNSYQSGDTTYTFDPSVPFYKSIWDAGGTDTIDISNFSTDCTVDLNAGHYSSVRYTNSLTGSNLYDGTTNLGIAFGVTIEIAKGGTGNDSFYCNSSGNRLYGGAGSDTFSVGSGSDYIDGGTGSDKVIFTGQQANYTIVSEVNGLSVKDNTGSDGTDTLVNVESLQFSDSTLSFSAVNDTAAPTLSSLSPTDAATDIAITSNIVLTFSESIQRGAGLVELHAGSVTGTVVESYNAATSTNLAFSGTTLTINPASNLVLGTDYFTTLASGAVKDYAGNSYLQAATYHFTSTPPPLTSMTHDGLNVTPARYTGPATASGGQGIHFQLLGSTAGEVLQSTEYNDFTNVLEGDDAVNAGAGNDVVDGGLGSNFLTGGAGTDIFFSDGRGGGTTWSTITDWTAGEELSVWGWRPGTSKILLWQQDGVTNFKGLTMHADLNGDGTIDTSVTFTGITSQSEIPTPLDQFDDLLWFK